MENALSQSESKHVRIPRLAEQEAPHIERVESDAASLLLRLRQLGDHGLRLAMQRLAENESKHNS